MVINIACEVAKEVLLSHWSGKVKVFKNLKRPTCGEDILDRLLRQNPVGVWQNRIFTTKRWLICYL